MYCQIYTIAAQPRAQAERLHSACAPRGKLQEEVTNRTSVSKAYQPRTMGIAIGMSCGCTCNAHQQAPSSAGISDLSLSHILGV